MNIGIIGLGLIGGSLGRAIVKRTTNKVYGMDSDAETMLKAELLKAYNFELNDGNIGDMDIVILALPPHVACNILEEISPKLKARAIVIDCVGNKRAVVTKMKKLSIEYPEIIFLGGHPMAGREYSGVRHSTVNLFDNASMIVVPVSQDIASLQLAKDFFLELGFKNVVMTTAEEHDRIISYTSQLAHVVSSAYVLSPTADSYLGFSAGSFRDMTRVARMNPDMWTELFIENKDNLTNELNEFIANLTEYRDLISSADREALRAKLDKGNHTRIDLDKLKNS